MPTEQTPQRGDWLALAVIGGAVAAVGVAGRIATQPNLGWYAALQKPFFAPPNWVFGPVWIVLYAFLAVAAWRVWRAPAPDEDKREALVFFALQLGLNLLWPFAFFTMQRTVSGLLVIVFLLSAAVATLLRFQRIDRVAGLLMLAYVAWIAFATVLNAAIVGLNP